MKKVFLFAIFLAGILATSGQARCNIKKVYAFYTVNMPGVQMVDENGNPVQALPQIERFIYLEWKGSTAPQIETVYYNRSRFTMALTKVEGSSISVGDKFGNNKPITIRAAKNYSLWKIDLQQENDKVPEATDCKNILLKIKSSGKICTYKIATELKLASLPRY
jgi:hypothetical protein